jgi:cytochrome c553
MRLRSTLLGPALAVAVWPTGGWAAASPRGEAIAQHGAAGAPPCTACHGSHGEGNAALQAPRLAGVGDAYLAEQLAAFAAGTRVNSVMSPVAKLLTVPEQMAVARYFSRLPPPVAPKPATSGGAALSPGAELALRGKWPEKLPACVQCHGPAGIGVGAVFPPLIGLPSAYMVAQIEAWQHGKRPPGPLGLMSAVARRLSPAETEAVAKYFAPTGTAQPNGTGR